MTLSLVTQSCGTLNLSFPRSKKHEADNAGWGLRNEDRMNEYITEFSRALENVILYLFQAGSNGFCLQQQRCRSLEDRQMMLICSWEAKEIFGWHAIAGRGGCIIKHCGLRD